MLRLIYYVFNWGSRRDWKMRRYLIIWVRGYEDVKLMIVGLVEGFLGYCRKKLIGFSS